METVQSGIAEVFVQESGELLNTIEQCLVSLEQERDESQIHELFRCFHTLKGSAGMAGFDMVSSLTHLAETRLDSLRNGLGDFTAQDVDLFLRIVDWVRDAVRGFEDAESHSELSKALGELSSGANVTSPAGDLNGPRVYRIRINFRPDIFNFGLDPLIVIQDIDNSGKILQLSSGKAGVPSLEDLDPERCYLNWQIIVETKKSREDIDAIFLFIIDDNEVLIDDITASYGQGTEEEGEIRLGDVLLRSGILTRQELDQVLAEQEQNNRKIGEVVLEKGLASSKDIEQALKIQEHTRKDAESSTVRVYTTKLDALMNLLGEIVIGQSSLARIANRMDDENGAALRNSLYGLDRVTREFQEQIMRIRMIPVGPLFSQFKRFVRDTAKAIGKDINLVIEGAETELDKTVIEKISDPLKHMVRNAIDHGIESAEERAAAGKPAGGTLTLKAYHQEGHVYICVADDGKGLNADMLWKKGIEKGLITSGEEFNREKAISLIFSPGFSTSEAVSDLSGRGVGMDVVLTNITALRGTVETTSKDGAGTSFLIKLPLTMAIIEGMLCRIGVNTYIVPLLSIVESIKPDKKDIGSVEAKGEVVKVRGDYIPLVRLYDYFGIKADFTRPEDALLLVVESDGTRLALLIDDLIGQQQVVIKNLDRLISRNRSISGAAILGDGSVALILDIHGLVSEIAKGM